MRSLAVPVLLILAALVLPFHGAAQPAKAPDEGARAEALRAYQKGMAHYNLDEYDEAVRQFEAGYRAVPQAVFLYNIAQAHRMANRPHKALEFYRKYIRQAPGAKNFREVQERIAALEELLAESSRPPEQTMAPSGPARPQEAPRPAEPPRAAPAPAPVVIAPVAEPPPAAL